MTGRPPKLPLAAIRALKACRAIPWGAKAVWVEDWILDGPEGAWISAPNLAERLGMSRENVEQHRRRLKELGFYHVIERRGARSNGWVPMLPQMLLPHGIKVADINAAARLIDAYLRGEVQGIGNHASNGRRGYATGGVGHCAKQGVSGSASHGGVGYAIGGVGGASLSDPKCEAQLLAQDVVIYEQRVGACAPKTESEEKPHTSRKLSLGEGAASPLAASGVADYANDPWERLRDRLAERRKVLGL